MITRPMSSYVRAQIPPGDDENEGQVFTWVGQLFDSIQHLRDSSMEHPNNKNLLMYTRDPILCVTRKFMLYPEDQIQIAKEKTKTSVQTSNCDDCGASVVSAMTHIIGVQSAGHQLSHGYVKEGRYLVYDNLRVVDDGFLLAIQNIGPPANVERRHITLTREHARRLLVHAYDSPMALTRTFINADAVPLADLKTVAAI